VGRRAALLVAAIVIAAIGTTLVYLYAKHANDRAIADTRPVSVLVATAQIPAGQTIEQAVQAASVVPQDIPSQSVAPGAVSNVRALRGKVAVGTIYPGQQILTQLFGETAGAVTGINIPKGLLAASFNFTDTARVAGFVQPGSQVAVFLTSLAAGPNQSQQATRLLLPKVQILAVGATTITPPTDPTKANPEALPRATMTIAVSQQQLETLVFAQTQGDLYLGLLRDDSIVKPDTGTNVDNLFQ
jgi:pilus assembly protein CpaB